MNAHASSQAKISVLGASRTIRFKCNLQPVSKMRLREVFIEGEMFGMRSLLPGKAGVIGAHYALRALHVSCLPYRGAQRVHSDRSSILTLHT